MKAQRPWIPAVAGMTKKRAGISIKRRGRVGTAQRNQPKARETLVVSRTQQTP
ncbi:hypothetical protein ACFLW2_01800 [Chloroflexota bacterium]